MPSPPPPPPPPALVVHEIRRPGGFSPLFLSEHPQTEALLDGGALTLAVEGRPGSQRIHFFRREGKAWIHENGLASGGAATLVAAGNLPRFAVEGGRIGVIWEGGGTQPPSLTASLSPDAGLRFLEPVVLRDQTETRSPCLAELHDGSFIAVWFEAAGVMAARLSPSFYLDPPAPIRIAPIDPATWDGARKRESRIAAKILQDYTGGKGGIARVLIAFTNPSLRVFELDVPEGALLATAAEDCHCAPTPEQLLGYPVRGTVSAMGPGAQRITLDLEAAPGVMLPGRHAFELGERAPPGLRPGARCLARIRRSGPDWILFDMRILGWISGGNGP